MLNLQAQSFQPIDDVGIKALLKQIADSHPWNQTWWGQLVIFGLTWVLGLALAWLAGRFSGFKEGIKSERDRPVELSASTPSLPAPSQPHEE